jgi:Cytochrome P460
MRLALKGGVALALAALAAAAVLGAEPTAGKPAASFEGKDTMLRPAGYREWVFVGSSLGLRYDEGERKSETLEYKNVYIDPAAYRAYRETGAFPQGTVLVLETAAGEEKKEPGLRGSFQREFTGLSAAVKDKDRFPDGWAYFSFGGGPANARDKAPPAKKSACYDCHRQKAADDNVFTQFYPVLRAAAKK